MKAKLRFRSVLVTLLAVIFMLTGCGSTQGTSTPQTNHEHTLIKLSSREATCLKEGRKAYWHCDGCGKYYLDAKAEQEVTLKETVIEKLPHTTTKTSGTEPTCVSTGRKDYYKCSDCNKMFLDEACTTEVENDELNLPTKAHELKHVEKVPAKGKENGVKEHWNCLGCGGFFADESGKIKISLEETIDYHPINIPDFVVEVPTGRDPVVLQLTDTQIIDAGQVRPGRTGIDHVFWATNQVEERCYDYLTEVINATNPDLIIMTGDNIYGEFDDKGTALTSLVNFMDSFEKPWAPIFGNHDNESKKGVDWQCEQFENAKYCLFEQKELTGNGNYSVGIVQGEELKRVFYMLDTNGCNGVSTESLANGHTVKTIGFKQDQIDWYTKQINIIKEYSPETKISFAFHIPVAKFVDACATYGYSYDMTEGFPINIDRLQNKNESDFGIIGEKYKSEWDGANTVYEGIKALGADSIFVGHEHCNSFSIVYEGIRFQFGQKSSQYDRYNTIDANGNVVSVFAKPDGKQSLVGGSVIVLGEEDGTIENSYIYYCGQPNGQIDWNKYN